MDWATAVVICVVCSCMTLIILAGMGNAKARMMAAKHQEQWSAVATEQKKSEVE